MAEKIPNFDIPEEELAFPEGRYLCALGGLRALYSEDDKVTPEAVNNDIWVIKYTGTDVNPVQDIRITLKDGKVMMGTRGVRIVERYPNPTKMPNMAWRARAFFSKFEAITEVDLNTEGADGKKNTKRVVEWSKVMEKYGAVFTVNLIYQKAKNGKLYRNIDYDSIELIGQSVPVNDMKAIEERYSALKAQEEGGRSTEEKPPDLTDLPF